MSQYSSTVRLFVPDIHASKLHLTTENSAHRFYSDKSLARPGMKQATATEDFHFHISYL
jgi:hypothetical protein